MKVVIKKILPKYFHDIKHNVKFFEIRKDEDDLQIGDIVIFGEWDGKKYTGARIPVTVRYVLRNVPEYGLKDGYCIFGWSIRKVFYTRCGTCVIIR